MFFQGATGYSIVILTPYIIIIHQNTKRINIKFYFFVGNAHRNVLAFLKHRPAPSITKRRGLMEASALCLFAWATPTRMFSPF